jgi:hypothetical protein
MNFLAERHVMDGADRGIADLEIALMNNPSSAGSSRCRASYQRCQDRLNQVISARADTSIDVIPVAWQSLAGFSVSNNKWNEAGSFIFHRDFPGMSEKIGVLKQRAQTSGGLCYMHVPVMLQHYLVCISSTKDNIGMVDMASMIHESFTPEQLYKHVFKDDGGNSLAVLEHLLADDSTKTLDIRYTEKG